LRAAAAWRFLDDDESRAKMICADCGRFEMSREQLEVVETEMPGLDDSIG